MTEKKDQVIYADFKNKKVLPGPPENQQAVLPEITEEEAKIIYRDIFDEFEPGVWHLCGLVKKAREKFDAFERLVSSVQYSEGHYKAYVNQRRPHRLGSKPAKERDIPQIFSEDEKALYGKIREYEKELQDYIENFLRERESMESKLHNVHEHLKNFRGAEDSRVKLEKYIEKIDFNFTNFVFMGEGTEGYRKKIEVAEEFAKKLIN